MIKPDGIQRGLVGRIIQRFESKGLQCISLALKMPTEEILREHYSALEDKPFFNDLLAYVSSGPVLCMVWKGREAVKEARRLIGATDPCKAEMGTIRGDFGLVSGRNIIHGADSVEAAVREISIWFPAEDALLDWEPCSKSWLVDA